MKVFVIAGEPSGDRLGGAVMAGLRQLAGDDIRFIGVGGELMQEQGLQSLFPMDELSVMGLAEILPKYRHLKRRIRECAEAVLQEKPDVLLTIDSPDFSLRVAGLVKARSSIRTVHYVAPSVWAWRAGRAQKMARVIDHVLALLPFEPPLMEAAGMECDFVGHPVVSDPVATQQEAQDFRDAEGLGEAPLLLLLPGSRRGEVSRLMPVFGPVLAEMSRNVPGLRAVLPAAANVAGLLEEMTESWPVRPLILDPRASVDHAARKRAAFYAADLALAASGTVSLELAASSTPMVIAYDMNWLTMHIMQRMALLDTVTLVNIVTDTRVVPEFLGKNCRPENIGPSLMAVLNDPSAQTEAMDLTMQLLGRGGEAPGLRAARAILSRL